MEPAVILLMSWAVATLGGIMASVYGYLTSPQKFNHRKFAIAVMTGLIGGLMFGIANASLNPVFRDANAQLFDVAYQLGLVFVGAVGIDFLRNRTGDMTKGTASTHDGKEVEVEKG